MELEKEHRLLKVRREVFELEAKILKANKLGKFYQANVSDLELFCGAILYGVYDFWYHKGIVFKYKEIPQKLIFKIEGKTVEVTIEFQENFYINVFYGNDLEKKTVEKYLAEVINNMEKEYSNRIFMKNYFDYLYVQDAITIFGSEALKYQKIYYRTLQVFPEFSKAKPQVRYTIMRNAQRLNRDKSKDISTLAHLVYAVIYAAGFDKIMIMMDPILRRDVEYHKIGQNEKIVKFNQNGKIVKRKQIIYVLYEYYDSSRQNKLKKSFTIQEIWKGLCDNLDSILS